MKTDQNQESKTVTYSNELIAASNELLKSCKVMSVIFFNSWDAMNYKNVYWQRYSNPQALRKKNPKSSQVVLLL